MVKGRSVAGISHSPHYEFVRYTGFDGVFHPFLFAGGVACSCFFGWQQHWYTKDGAEQPDFTASLVLSAIGLAFNLLANALIVMRFSANASYWKLATQLSLVCWIVKVSFMHLQYVWM